MNNIIYKKNVRERIQQLKTIEKQLLLQLSSIRGGIAELELLLKKEKVVENEPKRL